jgi:hypothetical protein
MDATNTHPKDKGKNITDTKSRNWHTYIYKLAQLPPAYLTHEISMSYEQR